ncbi:MAG TPA: HAMP domain-containing sensor histidine kinase [Candidatus Dormibacteraeota bacterium]|nr:HAMP domain-containing sensor histidine kinase [Candidatus Dormibacteraeota bacterium]
MTLSLRGRLLVGVIALVAIGLLVSDVATYALLNRSLVGRIDDQLQKPSTVATARAVIIANCTPGRGPGSPGLATDFPTGTITELLGTDGAVVTACVVGSGSTPSTASPVLPKTLLGAGEGHPVQPYTVEGTGGVSQYRMTEWTENSFGGQFVVFAIPLTPVHSTLSQLLLLETIIGLAVLGATVLLALIIIRISLRPLQKMGGVAADIAAGDLTKRVEPATPKTEIGRLGLALNGMLSQIEAAFAERTESNNRLRRFIADASHELRTPLTSIRGYSEMLRRGAGESPTDAELARRRIEEESVRMSTLVDDMLLIARLDQGRPLESKPVDLQAIAADAAADARAVAPKREITMTDPGPVVVEGDDLRLRQVLGNLVRNALVHTPSQTAIEISVSTEDSVGRVSVADHGPGLSPSDMERIFEPFFRADPSRSRDSGGAGLGLSIVNAVVSAHGGHVRVKETSGGGATFEVELPLATSSN